MLNRKLLLPLGFFLLILYIIFLANTADYNMGFALVAYIPYGDKVMHALLYGLMALFLNYGLQYRRLWGMQWGALLVLAFATVEELSQLFVATRTFDLGDLLADLIGVTLFSWRRLRLPL